MYFNINGNMDVSQMLSSVNGAIDRNKFCKQIIENDLSIDDFITCAEIEKWKKYYNEMHPQMRLCEDLAQKGITHDEIRDLYAKFFVPLMADSCSVTIVDPYMFSKNTNADLLYDILKNNIKSKSVRFYTDFRNDDLTTKNSVQNRLKKDGYLIEHNNYTDSHDRYWFSRVAGFTVGTSFNGIGKKLSTFSMLKQNDLSEIIKIFGM